MARRQPLRYRTRRTWSDALVSTQACTAVVATLIVCWIKKRKEEIETRKRAIKERRDKIKAEEARVKREEDEKV